MTCDGGTGSGRARCSSGRSRGRSRSRGGDEGGKAREPSAVRRRTRRRVGRVRRSGGGRVRSRSPGGAGGGAPGWGGRSSGRGRRTVRVGRVRQERHRQITPTAPARSVLSPHRPPNSDRRSRRSGANSETRRTRAPLSLRPCLTSRAVISRISDVASAVSRCGSAGPPSTARWRSRRVLLALLPQVIAGTLALLRIVICSMSLPTRTCAPGPGRVTLSLPRGPRVSRSRDSPSP